MLTIDVDAASLLRALDTLGEAAHVHLKEAARESAESIAREARGRLRRSTKGTGYTEAGITVVELHSGDGFAVHPWDPGRAIHKRGKGEPAKNLPIWLEFGTEKMSARPYLFVSADIEQGPHLRRVAIALQAAVDEVNR